MARVPAARTRQNKVQAASYIGAGVVPPVGGGTTPPTPTLGTLSLSASSGTVGQAFSATVTGRTAGSQLSLSGAGAAGLSVSGSSISGTPTSAGAVNVTETLAGATNSPRATNGVATIAEAFLADTPLALYGLARVVPASTYDGPAVHVIRQSDGAPHDIVFSGNEINKVDALAFQGTSLLEIDTAYDLTGGGKHATYAAGARPILNLGNGGPVISNFDPAPMTIPSSVVLDRRDCTVFMVCRQIAQSRGATFWELGAGGDFGVRNYSSAYANQPYADNAVIAPNSAPADGSHVGITNMSIVMTVSSPSGLVQHRDEKTLAFPAISSKALAGGRVGTGALVAASKFDVMLWGAYGVGKSSAAADAIKAVLKKACKTASPATRVIIEDGNSMTEGTGCIRNRTPAATLGFRLGDDGTIIRNIGVAGTTMAAQKNKWTTASRRFSQDGVPTILRSALGRNDIASIGTPTQTDVDTLIADAKTYYTSVRERNVADYIIGVCQTPSAIGRAANTASPTGKWNQAQDDAQAAYVAWMKSNPVDNNGLKIFNALEDQWGHPIIGHTPTVDGTQANGAFDPLLFGVNGSGDGIHPSEFANETYISVTQQTALNAMVPNPLSISGTPVTTANQNAAYSGFTITTRYGTAPYSYSLAPSSGALPTGMALNTSTGSPQGTPTAVETKTGIIIRVTDAAGATADLPAFQIAVSNPQAIVIDTITQSSTATDGTAFNILLPPTINAGDLLVVGVSIDGNSTITWDNATAGTWTQLFNDQQTADRLYVYYKVADGTEDGKTLVTTVSAAQQCAAFATRLTGAQGAVAASATGARGTGTSADPAIVTAPWGVANNLFMQFLSVDNYSGAAPVAPSGYGPVTFLNTSASGQTGLALAARSASAASEDAGAWTLAGLVGYITASVAVRPA